MIVQPANIESMKLDRITFNYDGRPPVFEDLDFDLPEHPLVWVKGQPGMGKSSFLKIFAGLLIPQSGRYLINGENVLDMSFREFLPYRLAIGYSFDLGGLLSNRTIYENLVLPLHFHGRTSLEEADARVRYWMDRFGLTNVAAARPFAVTGSQRKSSILLRAFIHYPQVVFLDDPMAGLKEDGRQAFSDLVEDGMKNHGLKRVVFCSERELPVKDTIPKVMMLSVNRKENAKVEAA